MKKKISPICKNLIVQVLNCMRWIPKKCPFVRTWWYPPLVISAGKHNKRSLRLVLSVSLPSTPLPPATGDIYWRMIFFGEWKYMMRNKTLIILLRTYYIYWTNLPCFEKKTFFICYKLYRKGKNSSHKNIWNFGILKCYRISNLQKWWRNIPRRFAPQWYVQSNQDGYFFNTSPGIQETCSQ